MEQYRDDDNYCDFVVDGGREVITYDLHNIKDVRRMVRDELYYAHRFEFQIYFYEKREDCGDPSKAVGETY